MTVGPKHLILQIRPVFPITGRRTTIGTLGITGVTGITGATCSGLATWPHFYAEFVSRHKCCEKSF